MTPPNDDAITAAFLEYDRALMRFWQGSSEDIDSSYFPDGADTPTMRALVAAHVPKRPRNWDEVVAPARAALIEAMRGG